VATPATSAALDEPFDPPEPELEPAPAPLLRLPLLLAGLRALDDPLPDARLRDEALAVLLRDALRLFGLDPFEVPLEDFRFVPDRELAWAIYLLHESNAPRLSLRLPR
jgi:hypothetical protein